MARIHRRTLQKDPHNPDNHEGVITHTHLELDILECEVRCDSGNITTNKASVSDGIPIELLQILKDDVVGDGIPTELLQILKDDAVKVLHSIGQQIWKTQQWPKDWKMSVFIPIPNKCNCKECSTDNTVALISHAFACNAQNYQNFLSQASTTCKL